MGRIRGIDGRPVFLKIVFRIWYNEAYEKQGCSPADAETATFCRTCAAGDFRDAAAGQNALRL